MTVHVGTTATAARVARDGAFAQLRLADPVVTARGDHVILRTETTVAGGTVLDPSPPRGLEPARLQVLDTGTPVEIVRALVDAPVSGRELQARGLLEPRSSPKAWPACGRRASTTSRRPGWRRFAPRCGGG